MPTKQNAALINRGVQTPYDKTFSLIQDNTVHWYGMPLIINKASPQGDAPSIIVCATQKQKLGALYASSTPINTKMPRFDLKALWADFFRVLGWLPGQPHLARDALLSTFQLLPRPLQFSCTLTTFIHQHSLSFWRPIHIFFHLFIQSFFFLSSLTTWHHPIMAIVLGKRSRATSFASM